MAQPIYSSILNLPQNTSTPSYIHWYSSHSRQTKLATLTSLFIRAYRICSPCFLYKEIIFIKKTFSQIKYPPHIVNQALKRAKNNIYNPPPPKSSFTQFLPIPNIPIHQIKKHTPPHTTLVPSSSLLLKHYLKPSQQPLNPPTHSLYQITCSDCPLKYFGETNDFETRKYQHKYDLSIDSQSSALTNHRSLFNHTITTNNMISIKHIPNKYNRKLAESFCIKNLHNFNKQAGEINLDHIQNTYLKTSNFFQSLLKIENQNLMMSP